MPPFHKVARIGLGSVGASATSARTRYPVACIRRADRPERAGVRVSFHAPFEGKIGYDNYSCQHKLLRRWSKWYLSQRFYFVRLCILVGAPIAQKNDFAGGYIET